MGIWDMLYDKNPDLKEKHESKQYEMSNELIKYKVENFLNQQQMADIIGISLSEYLDLEYCVDYKGTLDKYEYALSKLSQNKI